MTLPKLVYFDAPISRGEECRLAFAVAGVLFHDERVAFADWPALKATAPFGAMPYLVLPGGEVLAQSNAILVYVGREHGLHPLDSLEAAQHEAMMGHVEDLRAKVSPTLRLGDAEKKTAREALVADFFPVWGAQTERVLAARKSGPFFSGETLQVVDLKLHMILRWFNGGKVDHIPADVFAKFERLTKVHDAVAAHPAVVAWSAL